MKLMRIPARVLEHPNFRKPLAKKVEVVDISGSREWPWDFRAPIDVDIDHDVRSNRLRQGHRRNRFVRGVAVIRRDESKTRCQIVVAVQRDAKRSDVSPAPRVRSRSVGIAAEAP